MLTAYIDESNQTTTDWMSVAGFCGTDEQWGAYVPAWRAAINPRQHLHMNELRFNSARAEKRVKPMLERAGAVPDKCGLEPMFGMVRYSDYADLVDSEDERLYCGYIACCLPMVMSTLRGIPANERIELVFERQDRHWATLELALWTIVHFGNAEMRLPDGRSKLAKWRSVEKGPSCFTEASDYFAYALTQYRRDPASLRARWCSPILKSSGGVGYGRVRSREESRRIITRAKYFFQLGNEIPKLSSQTITDNETGFPEV